MGKNKVKYSFYAELEGTLAAEFAFLGKAGSTDETRFFMNWILVEPIVADDATKGLRGVSTDGRRIHLVEPLCTVIDMYGLTPGLYKVVPTSKRKSVSVARVADESMEECGKFPNWQRVMPEGEGVKKLDFRGFSLSGKRSAAVFRDIIAFFRAFPEPTAIDHRFLADLPLTAGTWECHYWEPCKALKFIANNLTAVIMPMTFE